MIEQIRAIAVHTFKEAVRDRVLLLFLVFAILLIASSTVLAWLTVGSELKIVTDLGLAALSVFGVMMAVFIGITLVHKEVEKRTIYAVLAKPVRRWQFLIGKYVGLMLTLAAVSSMMAGFLLALVWWKGGVVPTHLLPAILLSYFELGVITSIALLFSTITTPILAAVFTLSAYLVGHLTWGLRELMVDIPSGAGRWLLSGLYYVLPYLETFNVRAQVTNQVPVGPAYVLNGLAYAAAYSAGMILLAILLFRRRDLT